MTPKVTTKPRALRQLMEAYANVYRRMEIFAYPIREMQDREWIETTDDTDELESELCHFFHASSVAAIPSTPFSSCAGPRAEVANA